ncbi:MAG: hypothetical protein GY807_06870 [Gammaproteobacteria bacterium]|nr:hypothetical protein [Gammaproteobacteria bacterium]
MAGPWERYQKSEGPWTRYQKRAPAQANQDVMSNYEPGLMERAGNFLYDTAKDMGLPASRMRRDAQNLDHAVRGAADTLSFGTADEIAAGANAALGGDYETELERQRLIDERGGGVRTVGQVAGAMAGGLGLAKRGLSPAYNTVKSGKGVWPVVKASTAEGAALAGSHGFGSGEGGLENRAENALNQGMAGAGIGAAVPVATKVVSTGLGKIANPFRSAQTKAERLLSRSLERDGLTPGQAAAQLDEMGQSAMPMDLAPNIRETAEGMASMPGPAKTLVKSALDERAAGASQRVIGATDQALGQPIDTLAAADDIIARRSAAAKPLYDAAYAKPVPYTRDLETLLKRPAAAQALRKAQTLAANEGVASQQWFANIADDGKVTIERVPDIRQLDLTKRALDDMIDGAKRAGNNNEARILTGLKTDLVGMMDDAVPEYAQARNAFAGPSAVLDAMEDGRGIFKNQMTPAELQRTLAGMGQSEQEAYQQGARAAIADIMGTARNDANAARAMFEKGYNQDKLALLVGKEQADQLLKQLDNERTFMHTRNQVLGNSRTAPRQEIIRDLGGNPGGPGFFRNLLNTRFGDAAAQAGDAAVRTVRKPAIEANNEMLARLITDRRGLTDAAQRIDSSEVISANRRAIVDALLRNAGISGYPRTR